MGTICEFARSKGQRHTMQRKKKTRQERAETGYISMERRAELNRARMWSNLKPALPVVIVLLTVVPIWAYHSETTYANKLHAKFLESQSMVNDLTRFEVSASPIHGSGLKTTVSIKQGELLGLHWFEVKPNAESSYDVTMWPHYCIELPGEVVRPSSILPGISMIGAGYNYSDAPMQLLPEEARVGCLQRAVNHQCVSSAEIKVVDAPTLLCSAHGSRHIGGGEAECVPDQLSRFNQAGPVRAVYLRALRDMLPGDEITYNYLTAPDFFIKESHVVAGCPNM